MAITIWGVLIFLCFICCITHPTKIGIGIGAIFLAVAILPEPIKQMAHYFLSIPKEGWLSYTIQAMVVMLGIIVLSTAAYSKLYSAVMLLFVGEMVINVFGIISWGSHLSIYASNYIFDLSGVSLAYMYGNQWLYNTALYIYYMMAIVVLYDKAGRKQNDGYWILQCIGNSLLAPNIRFKGMDKWTER
jgi:hypothetical protein